MEPLHRTNSSSNPDLLSLLSSSQPQPLKRTNSATDLSSGTDVRAPLHSVPSFSIYVDELPLNESNQEPSSSTNPDFVFSIESDPKPTEIRPEGSDNASPLFLARGLGIDRLGSELLDVAELMKGQCSVENKNGEEKGELEKELKRAVEEEPNNATALSDYAEFLFQKKGDAKRAEEYYSRAILADPTNGEIMAQYAKLVWHMHADVERTLCYFEKAVQVSPENSYVYAAYAGFLWEIDDEGGSQSILPPESADKVLV